MHGATLTLIILIIVSGLTIYYSIRTRHLERMARIEHGMSDASPSFFNSPFFSMGIFLVSLGLSLLISYLLSRITSLPDHVLIPGSLLLFGGSALLIIAYIGNPKKSG